MHLPPGAGTLNPSTLYLNNAPQLAGVQCEAQRKDKCGAKCHQDRQLVLTAAPGAAVPASWSQAKHVLGFASSFPESGCTDELMSGEVVSVRVEAARAVYLLKPAADMNDFFSFLRVTLLSGTTTEGLLTPEKVAADPALSNRITRLVAGGQEIAAASAAMAANGTAVNSTRRLQQWYEDMYDGDNPHGSSNFRRFPLAGTSFYSSTSDINILTNYQLGLRIWLDNLRFGMESSTLYLDSCYSVISCYYRCPTSACYSESLAVVSLYAGVGINIAVAGSAAASYTGPVVSERRLYTLGFSVLGIGAEVGLEGGI